MKRKTNRILSLLLAFVMAFSLVPTAAAAAGSNHTHSLTWKNDATQHWQECSAPGCPQTIQNLGSHDFGEWKETKPATCIDFGSREHSCKTCSWVASEKTNIKSDAHQPRAGSYSWNETNPGVHLYICDLCGKPQSEGHSMQNGKCEKCGYTPPAVTATSVSLNKTYLSLKPTGSERLTATVYPAGASQAVTWTSSDPSVATVDQNGNVYAVKNGSTTITVKTADGTKYHTCTVTVSNSNGTLKPTYSTYSVQPGGRTYVSVTADRTYYNSGDYVRWTLSGNSNVYFEDSQSSYQTTTSFNNSSYRDTTGLYIRAYSGASGTALLTADLYSDGKFIDTLPITIYIGDTNSNGFSLYPTPSTSSAVYLYYDDYYRDDYWWNSSYRYYRDFSVDPRFNNSSILNTGSSYYGQYTVYYTWKVNNTVQGNSSTYSNKFTLYADNSSLNRNSRNNTLTCTAEFRDKAGNYAGTASAQWSVYTDYYNDSAFTVSATVYDTTSRYNLNDKDDKNGSSIISQISDKLYSSSYSRDYISYVRFSNVSSSYGSLDASTSRDYYYESSRSGYYDLRDVEFTPSKTGTASFDCTVYTTRGYNYKCTINIKVEAGTTDKTASTINYSTKGTKSVTLSASDFTSRYKDVVGSSASTLTIKFRNVPSNGTLKYNSTTLTSSNIGNYEFSSSSSASYRISDVTYTPKNNSNTTDTIDYYCYSGSTRRFSGSIKFTNTAETVTVPSGVTVSYSTTGASVTFSAPDFYNKHSAMLSASYIVFGSPTSGTLSSGGSAISSGTKFGYTVDTAKGYKNLASVSYKSASGYNGTATIPFTAYNSDGTTAATGNVSILVSQTTTTTPTTPTNTAKTFKDVASTAWYASDVAALSAAGIVSGDNNGNFRPQDAVTYGEALKMVMIASGYPKQNELTGANWAQNYLTQAISNSILSGSASDYTLSKSINRTAMATVAAKALKLTPVTNAASSPYTDTSDSYVLALTNAGIVQGDASSGQTKWRGGDTLTRAEMSRIVYNIYKYRNVAPGGSSTSTTTDTSKPDWLK